MKRTHKIRQDTLPREILRHLEQQGLGRVHDVYPQDFWITLNATRKGR